MSEIKVGEYFRTNTGFIDKLNKYWLFNEKYKKLNIVKHSPNIIDLVEEGDYVNGDRMDLVEKDENGHTYYMQNVELPSVNLKEIKSIVTKEQFQSLEYRLEE